MAEEKKEKRMTYMAITTILIAVAATLSTFKGGGFSTRSLLNQTLASDQWAFYQSKSIKSYIYEMRRENLEIQVTSLEKQKGNEELISKYNGMISDYTQKVKNYELEIKDIILLSSIATLSKKRFVWICGLVLGLIGIFYF